jgi:hypothetical protein
MFRAACSLLEIERVHSEPTLLVIIPCKAYSPGRWHPLRPPTLIALFAVLGFAKGAFSAEWLQDSREPPLHPTVITAEYKGKPYPVIAVTAEIPEINAEGELRKLYSGQSYQTPRAVRFAPGSVSFKAQNASSVIRSESLRFNGFGAINGSTLPEGTVSATGDYECTIVSPEAHSDCYIAVIFARRNREGGVDTASTAIAFRQIGDLAAGRETKVKINCSYVAPKGYLFYYFPLIFSKGLEIRTDQSEIAARFFRISEMASHEALLAQYRKENATADRPAVAYLRFQPELPPDVDPRSLPPMVNARFAVTESGEVDAVTLDQVLDARVDREIRRALDGWLFLPRLRKGYPVRTQIVVPLSFGGAPS